METTQIRDKLLSVEEVWAILQETNRTLDRVSQETNRTLDRVSQKHEEIAQQQAETALQMKETDRQMKETDRQMKETDRQMKETDRRMKETDKRIGEFTNRFGEVVEYMITPNLETKFEELGFTFTASRRTEFKDKIHNIFTEVDALLENGDNVMAVEIKTKPSNDDIKDHIERMEKLRTRADLLGDKRVYLGAMAGVVFSDNVKTFALKNGFYVIQPSGDSFTITVPEGEYHRREW